MTKTCYGASHVPLSPAVRAGDFVFVSGQVPVVDGKIVGDDVGNPDPPGPEKRRRRARKWPAATSCDIVKTTVWLKHAEDFAEFNKAYAESFPSDPPARSTAESRLMIDIRVEIEAVAYKPL